jgi:hypothetical protein
MRRCRDKRSRLENIIVFNRAYNIIKLILIYLGSYHEKRFVVHREKHDKQDRKRHDDQDE